MKITLSNGKYEYVSENGNQAAYRHGEMWRDLTGDNFIYAMACKIKELEQERSELEAQVERLEHERDDALALVIRYQRLLECAIRGEEFIVGDTILIGIDAELADEIDESFDESPKTAVAALKEQWQAEAVDRCEKEVTESVNVLLKPHIAGVFAVIRQRAQETSYE